MAAKGLGVGVGAKGITKAQNLRRAATIGGFGEGAVTAGQNLEQVRQETPNELLTPTQVGLNVGAGAITGVIGALGGKLAARLGLEDFNTLLLGVRNGVTTESMKQSVVKVLKSAVKEGVLEELPQSMQEQVAQNLSLGKPITEGMYEQGAMGLLAGMVQGGGAQVAGSVIDRIKPPAKTPVETALQSDPLEQQRQTLEDELTQDDPDLKAAIEVPPMATAPAPELSNTIPENVPPDTVTPEPLAAEATLPSAATQVEADSGPTPQDQPLPPNIEFQTPPESLPDTNAATVGIVEGEAKSGGSLIEQPGETPGGNTGEAGGVLADLEAQYKKMAFESGDARAEFESLKIEYYRSSPSKQKKMDKRYSESRRKASELENQWNRLYGAIQDVKAGKPVPPEVLKDYPELTPKVEAKLPKQEALKAKNKVVSIDKIYKGLLSKATPSARGLYELSDKQVPPAMRMKLYRGPNDRVPIETESFSLRPKADVTGDPYDKGWILKDKKSDYISRTPLPEAGAKVETLKERGERTFKETEAKFAEEAASTETITERESRRKAEKVSEITPAEKPNLESLRQEASQIEKKLREGTTTPADRNRLQEILKTPDLYPKIDQPRTREEILSEIEEDTQTLEELQGDLLDAAGDPDTQESIRDSIRDTKAGIAILKKEIKTVPTPRNATEVKAPIIQTQPSEETLQINPMTGGRVSLADTKGNSLGTFDTPQAAAKQAKDMGYKVRDNVTPPPPPMTRQERVKTGKTIASTVGLSPATAKLLLDQPAGNRAWPAGPHLSQFRQKVIQELTGQKLPQSKTGATAVRTALAKAAGIDQEGKALNEIEKGIEAWMQGVVKSTEAPIVAKPTRPSKPAKLPSQSDAQYMKPIVDIIRKKGGLKMGVKKDMSKAQIATGFWALSDEATRKQLLKMYGPKILQKSGMEWDEAAEEYGYESDSQLLDALMDPKRGLNMRVDRSQITGNEDELLNQQVEKEARQYAEQQYESFLEDEENDPRAQEVAYEDLIRDVEASLLSEVEAEGIIEEGNESAVSNEADDFFTGIQVTNLLNQGKQTEFSEMSQAENFGLSAPPLKENKAGTAKYVSKAKTGEMFEEQGGENGQSETNREREGISEQDALVDVRDTGLGNGEVAEAEKTFGRDSGRVPDHQAEPARRGETKPGLINDIKATLNGVSTSILRVWETKLEGFKNGLQRVVQENRAGKTSPDTLDNRQHEVLLLGRLRDQRRVDARIEKAIRNKDEHWDGVRYAPEFADAPEFGLAKQHFGNLGYDVVPISEVKWGGCVDIDDSGIKTVFLGVMNGWRFAYFMSHETSHILSSQGNEAITSLKKAIDLSHPFAVKQREGFVWTDDYARDEFVASITGGMTKNEAILKGDQAANIKSAREASVNPTPSSQRGAKTGTSYGFVSPERRPFYSKLAQTVEATKDFKWPLPQLKAYLLGKQVTKDEITNILSGLEGTVTKQQVMDAIAENTQEFADVMLGGGKEKVENRITEIDRIIASSPYENRSLQKERDRLVAKRTAAPTQFDSVTSTGAVGAIAGTYRELTVTMPSAGEGGPDIESYYTGGAFNRPAEIPRRPLWRDQHDQYRDIANPVIRIHFDDRNVSGKRILFIREMQSIAKTKPASMPQWAWDRAYDIGVKRILAYAKENGYDGIAMTTGRIVADRYNLAKQIESVRYWQTAKKGVDGATSDFYAVEMTGKDGSKHDVGEHPASALEGAVGKELTAKILKSEGLELAGSATTGTTVKEFSGLDLEIGGEWAIDLYGNSEGYKTDQEGNIKLSDKGNKEWARIPGLFKKYGKEGVGEVTLDTKFIQDKPFIDYDDPLLARARAETATDSITVPMIPITANTPSSYTQYGDIAPTQKQEGVSTNEDMARRPQLQTSKISQTTNQTPGISNAGLLTKDATVRPERNPSDYQRLKDILFSRVSPASGKLDFQAVQIDGKNADFIKGIAGIFGGKVQFFRSETPELRDHYLGFTDQANYPDTIFLNVQSPAPHFQTLGHELMHQLQMNEPELFAEFLGELRPYITKIEDYKLLMMRNGDFVNDPQMFREFTAEFIEHRFMDQKFWDGMIEKNPSVFSKVVQYIKSILDKVKEYIERGRNIDSDYISDLNKARQIAVLALTKYRSRQAARGASDVSGDTFMPSKTFHEHIDKATSYYTNSQSLPQSEMDAQGNYWKNKSASEFKFWDNAVNVPFRFAQKYPLWSEAWDAHVNRRQANRTEIITNSLKTGEDFLGLQKAWAKAGVSKKDIASGLEKIQQVVTAGDIMLHDRLKSLKTAARGKAGQEFIAIQKQINALESSRRYSNAELHAGITDEYGNNIPPLNSREIAAYTSLRKMYDESFHTMIDHQLDMSFQKWRTKKWYHVLQAAAGMGLDKETTQTLLTRKGLNKAALAAATKIQPNIQAVFSRLDQNITEVPDAELKSVAAKYEKSTTALAVNLQQLQKYLGEVTGIKDQTELSNLTRELFSAYQSTRPHLKKINQLRNDFQNWPGYAPRVRESGSTKVRLLEKFLNADGTYQTNEQGIPVPPREIHMEMVNNERQDTALVTKLQDLYGKNGKFPANYFIEREAATVTPESAFLGVNDVNVQKIIDDSINKIRAGEPVYNAAGELVDVADQLRDAAYQAISDTFKARGAGRYRIHRNQDYGAIKGYKERGLQKVAVDYISSMTGLMTKQQAASDMLDILSRVKDPAMFEAMSKWNTNQLRNESKADRVAGIVKFTAFTYMLGGLIKAPVINATQPWIAGVPELKKYMQGNGIKGIAAPKVGQASLDILRDKLTPLEKRLTEEAILKGDAAAQYIQSVMQGLKSNFGDKFADTMSFLAFPFGRVETHNRLTSFVAMFRLSYPVELRKAKEAGLRGKEAEEAAYQAAHLESQTYNNNVNYSYGKTNYPMVIQTGGVAGAGGAALYTFKAFPHNFLARQAELLSKGDLRTFMHTLAYMAMFGGLMGLPFFKDAFEWFEKHYGYSPTNAVRRALRGMGGDTLEKLGVSGLPSVLGANISGSINIGLPWPIGATDPFDSIFGVVGALAKRTGNVAQAIGKGDTLRAIGEASPEFIRAPVAAMKASQAGKELFGAQGFATNPRGNVIYDENGKPLQLSRSEAVLKAAGFNPTNFARQNEKNATVMRLSAWVAEEKNDIAVTLRIARLKGKPTAIKDAMDSVRELNAKMRSRGLQHLGLANMSRIIQASRQIQTNKNRKEARLKRAEM